MTREEAKSLLENISAYDIDSERGTEKQQALEMAIEVLGQELCDDAIDRAEAMTEIMMFAGNVKPDEEDIYIKVSDAVQLLRELPPVTPQLEKICVANIHFDEERFKEICKNASLMILDDSNAPTIQPKTGRWIDIMVGDIPAQECDQCNTFYPLAYTGGGHKYCPNCGAKMEFEPSDHVSEAIVRISRK